MKQTISSQLAAGLTALRQMFSSPFQMEDGHLSSFRQLVFSEDAEGTLASLESQYGPYDASQGPQQADTYLDKWLGPEPAVEVTENGLAIVPMQGVLMRGAPYYIKRMFGIRNTDELDDDMREAANDDRVKRIALYTDCPGGSALGIPESAALAKEISRSKPVFTVVDGLCASAAYFVASGTRRIYASPSSLTGSLGTIMTAWDHSGFHKMMGQEPEVITNKAGMFKGANAAGLPLTEEQRTEAQRLVEALNDVFFKFVLQNRLVEKAAMRGQVLETKRALASGLIDFVMPASEALSRIERARVS